MSELFKTIKKQFKVIKNEINGLKLKIERDFEKMEKEINDMSIDELQSFIKWVDSAKKELTGEKS